MRGIVQRIQNGETLIADLHHQVSIVFADLCGFTELSRRLDAPELVNLEAGIVLQAYLPDALPAMIRLQDWSAARRRGPMR